MPEERPSSGPDRDPELPRPERPTGEAGSAGADETVASGPPGTSPAAAPSPESLEERLRQRFGADATLGRAGAPGDVDPRAAGAHGPAGRRYEVGDEIARGGMGAIVRVWDKDLRRNLAMKVMLGAHGGPGMETSPRDQRIVSRFLEEAQITGQLDHPGIVPVHELGIDENGRLWFTMQLVRGRDLQQIYKLVAEEQEGWNPTRALGVLLKACEAMAYAHSKGVVHRDLKPANVMVGRFGEVYVMDWGVARVLGEKDPHDLRMQPERGSSGRPPTAESGIHVLESQLVTMDGDIVGTPAYIAPEQARGQLDKVGPRSDVYSIGAMLYQLLTGHIPYVTGSGRDQAHKVLIRLMKGPPTPVHELNPDVPPELVAICEKAMERDLDDRYESMEDLADDLRAYLERRVVRAYETGAVAELRKWVARNKALAATAAVAILSALGGLGATGYVQAEGRRAADEQRVIAQAERDKVLRLADEKRLRDLVAAAAQLWPATPDRVPAYEDWLARAEELAQRVELHRGALAEIEALDEPTPEQSWQADVLADLVGELERFQDPASGDVAGIRERLEFARTLAERSVDGPAARAAWRAATSSIADADACPAYGGLTVRPQLGLLPVGRDPDSGLWEFVHLQTGDVPERGEDGRLQTGPGTGLVLVLLPGGEFVQGAQSTDPGGRNHDPDAGDREGPPQRVRLDPFFLSKYEMTQAQWERFTDDNPTTYRAGRTYGGMPVDATHPVEQVSWDDCTLQLGRLGLCLPTEAQWEYAARGGTSTPWWTGTEDVSLQGKANVADAFARRTGVPWPDITDSIDDGYATHAPVGSYAANPFGLHDVHGNVWEWCEDHFAEYERVEARPGDGLRDGGDRRLRVFRGGGFPNPAGMTRSAWRNSNTPDFRDSPLGVRPARRLDG